MEPTMLTPGARFRIATGLTLLALTAAGGAASWQVRTTDQPTPPLVQTSGPVTFTGQLDRTAVRVGSDGLTRMELTVRGAARPDTAPARTPTDLVVVLDRSGSMSGDKIVHARAAVHELVRQLDPQDRFALVAYASEAEVAIPLSPATTDARARWGATIDAIGPTSGTNMASGIDLALGMVGETRGARHATRLILISDGHANEGDATQEGLVARAVRAARGEFPMSAVGVGTDFNETLMTALADAGTGNYYFLEHARDLANTFARELHATRATVATGLAVEIEPGPGVRVLDAAGYPLEHDGAVVRFRPGTLFAGQERRIWVTLAMPADRAAEHAIGPVRLVYADGTQTHTATLPELPRIAAVTSDDAFFARIDRPTWERAVTVEGYNTMQDAVARQVKEGKREQAKQVLDRFRAETRAMNERLASPAAAKALDDTKALEAEVDAAFVGANQKGKQNTLSKSRGAASYDARRAGSKY